MNKITAETRYNVEGAYCTSEDFEEARKIARSTILKKYIDEDSRTSLTKTITKTRGWFGRIREYDTDYNYKYENPSAADARRTFLKFYDNIMADLKAIDEQKDPAATKH